MPATTRHLRTLRSAYGEFVQHLTPRLLGVTLLALAVARALWTSWSGADLLAVVALVALQPFTEWAIHVHVLHCPADGGVRDRLAGASHRRHHDNPRELRFQFIHPAAVTGGLLLGAAVVVGVKTPAVMTSVLTATALTLTYEWVHFLIHTDYAPRHEPYRRLHRAHRLHHFRNEHYWLGVTGRTGDRLLGTNPGKGDVPISPTARTALARR
jgi:hypothetical protein